MVKLLFVSSKTRLNYCYIELELIINNKSLKNLNFTFKSFKILLFI